MEKRQREIVALVLLLALIAFVVCFGIWYLIAGHSWNVAATTIDDRVGNMDGYVVVLYEGTDEPHEISVDALGSTREASTVLLADTKKSYGDKGATVFSLRTSNFRYSDTFVLLKNGYRIGFIPVDENTPYLTIDKQVALLQKRQVDLIVVLEYSVNQYVRTVEGVDIILQLGEEPKADGEDNDSSGSASSDADSADEDVDATPTGTAADDGENAENVEVLTEEQQRALEAQQDSLAASGEGAASGAVSGEGASSTGSQDAASASSAASGASGSSTTESQASSAYVVDRRDRGRIAAVLISPNNVVSTKTISE